MNEKVVLGSTYDGRRDKINLGCVVLVRIFYKSAALDITIAGIGFPDPFQRIGIVVRYDISPIVGYLVGRGFEILFETSDGFIVEVVGHVDRRTVVGGGIGRSQEIGNVVPTRDLLGEEFIGFDFFSWLETPFALASVLLSEFVAMVL